MPPHQVFINRLNIARLKFLRPQSIASTKYRNAIAHNRLYILVQRFTNTARFFGTIQHRNRPHRFWQRTTESVHREWPIQMHLDQPQSTWQVWQCFFYRFTRAAHGDDNKFRIFITHIIDQVIFTPRKCCKLIHTILYNFRCFFIQWVCRLAPLEIDVWILRSPADCRFIRRHTTRPIFQHQFFRNHFFQHFVRYARQARFFVTGTKPIKEVQERHPRPQCGCMRNRRHIVRLLHIVRRQHRKPSRTHRHNITVVAKNRQRMCCQRTRRHMHNKRRLFTGDFIHIRNHQQ